MTESIGAGYPKAQTAPKHRLSKHRIHRRDIDLTKIKMGKGKDGTDAAAIHGRNTAVCAGLTICIAVITFIIGLAR